MNSNWRNRPTTIDFIDRNRIDAIINIDESGSANLKQVVKAKHAGTPPADSEKHFTVTACVISMADFAEARDMVMALKNKYWTDGLYSYKGIQKRVCFHSREIRGRKDAFNPDIIDYKSFVADLSQLMAAIPMCIYASHIDKERHVNQYIHPIEPYDLCMTFVLERILRDLPVNQNCVIILESRGAKEDRTVLDFIKGLINNGTQICKLFLYFRLRRTGVEICNGTHKEPLTNTLFELCSIQLIVILSNQVKNITENNRIGGSNQLVTDISSLGYDVDKVMPVIQVHYLIQSILENLEIIMTRLIGELSGF